MNTSVFNDGHIVERDKALLAAVAGFLHAAERQLDAAARAVAVDENLPGADLSRHPHRAIAVARPDAGDEAVVGGIGEAHRLGLVVERHRREDRAEHFLLHERAEPGSLGA